MDLEPYTVGIYAHLDLQPHRMNESKKKKKEEVQISPQQPTDALRPCVFICQSAHIHSHQARNLGPVFCLPAFPTQPTPKPTFAESLQASPDSTSYPNLVTTAKPRWNTCLPTAHLPPLILMSQLPTGLSRLLNHS